MIADSSQLALDAQVRRAQLDIMITNEGAGPVRVWDRSNSWGWNTLALEVASPPPSEDYYALTAKPRSFTRNGPGFIEIPSGACHLVIVAPENPEWEGLEHIGHLRGEALRVRAILRIPPSPEAEKYNVFVGEVSSPWQDSEPPHRWLFGDA